MPQASSYLSPTKDALHQELQEKSAALGDHITPSSFKHLGPGTAVREYSLDGDADSDMDIRKDALPSSNSGQNMNDVCFGCDGRCSDATCDSKRSSRISADVESNSCDTPSCRSPVHTLPRNDLERQCEGHHDLDNCNMILEETELSGEVLDEDSDKNGNSHSGSPTKRSPRSSARMKTPKSPKSPKGRGVKKFKRLRSETAEESPSKKGHINGSTDSLHITQDVVSCYDAFTPYFDDLGAYWHDDS